MAKKRTNFDVLGIHRPERVPGISQKVARVRFVIGKNVVDEDIPVPELPSYVPDTDAICAFVATEAAEKRYAELLTMSEDAVSELAIHTLG